MDKEIGETETVIVSDVNPQPVFVVGVNGSGTSMLADSLGHHPDLYMTRRETRLIPYLASKVDELGNLADDANFRQLWERVRHIPMFRKINEGQLPPIPANWQKFPRDFPSVLDGVFRYFAAREGKVRWGEKTPQHMQHMLMLHTLFPEAKFVHVIRDGRDCAASFHRRWQRIPELAIYRWKKMVNEGRRQGQILGDKYIEVRYEDVTSAPEYWMEKICEFLNLSFDPSVLHSAQPHKENRVENGKIEPNSGKWSNYFDAKKIKRLEAIAGGTLEQLGYSTKYQAGDSDPPRWRLTVWKLMDDFRQFFTQVYKNIRNKNKFTIHKMFRVVTTSIKQKRTNRY